MTKHLQNITRTAPGPNDNGWATRHVAAINLPHKAEIGIVSMLRGWLQYADTHSQRYESGIGDDYVLGAEWRAIGGALLGLLNGELGRLDGGSLDGLIRDTLRAEGFDPDNL